ncbi:MAG: phosphatidate cytidylyltransferase [Treponema sp.]|nr:phosphatidate cytidylyltransferase [Treponema sp.]
MKKIIERLLVFFIGIPLVSALVLLLPYKFNLALNMAVIFFSGMGALELSSMLEKKLIHIPKAESFILGALAPFAVTLHISFGLPQWIIPAVIMSGAGWSLISRVFSRKAEIEFITNYIIGCFSVLIYPGFFICWIVFMSGWGNPPAILLFLFITFGNDSIAWLFGTLFGANNRGIIIVSPNKSIAGFIGGIFGSLIISIGAILLFTSVFPLTDTSLPNLIHTAVIIGICTGIAASLGDLAESAIKRSCDFKDSGNFMLGRGGVLDSIDSIAVAAPVFFLLFSKLLNV